MRSKGSRSEDVEGALAMEPLKPSATETVPNAESPNEEREGVSQPPEPEGEGSSSTGKEDGEAPPEKKLLEDPNVKRLWEVCQDPDLYSLSSILDDLEQDTLEKIVKKDGVDEDGMNIFHVLLFDQQNEPWYTKELETKTRKNVVQFIEAICQRIGEENIIEEMMSAKDKYKRTPLHYSGIIDGEKENDESNITMALLKCGAEMVLFEEDTSEGIPVNFIATSNLKSYLDTKQKIKGPVGHKDTMVHCYVSALQPKSSQKNSLNFDFLEILAEKHRDLFDHQVISAMIW